MNGNHMCKVAQILGVDLYKHFEVYAHDTLLGCAYLHDRGVRLLSQYMSDSATLEGLLTGALTIKKIELEEEE